MSRLSRFRASFAMWATTTALLPVLLAVVSVYGIGALIRFCLAGVAAMAAEAVCLAWRRQNITLGDGSALLTGGIIGLCMPPLVLWYVPVFAAVTGIVLAKHCYGGLGNNPFNPAMAGYALAIISFPGEFAAWHTAADSLMAWESLFADTASTPTPLQAARLSLPAPPQSLIISLTAVAGGAFLLLRKIADWRLSVSFLLGVAVVIGFGDGDWRHLWHGSLLFTAFFVVTDPVTAANTPSGRWLYGAFVGALAMWLRDNGAHADSIAFAVLIGNLFAGVCDYPARQWHSIRRSS